MTEPSQLDPKIRYVWMVGSLIPAAVLGLVTLGLFIADVPIAPWVTGGLALLDLVLGLTLPVLRWRSWGYILTPTELIVRFGVVVRVERWLPRTRVQHVDLIAGPVERSLGLSQLVIYTAGTREADVVIPGLTSETATGLRAELLSWSTLDGDPEEADDPIGEPPPVEDVDRVEDVEGVEDLDRGEGEALSNEGTWAGAGAVESETPVTGEPGADEETRWRP